MLLLPLLLLLLHAPRAAAQCTSIAHQDFDEGNLGPQSPATGPDDCCSQCAARGDASCWVAVFVVAEPGPAGTCWFKTQSQSTRPYEAQDRDIVALWPAGHAPTTTPPPGCKVDKSAPYSFICVGQSLVLRACNCSGADSQHFWTSGGGGNIRHDDFATAPGFGDAVQAYYGNNEGFPARFGLETNEAQGGPSNHPDQNWFERTRGSNVTIITNLNTTGLNISQLNVSEIEGCRQWAVDGEKMEDGAYLLPAPCVAGAPNRSWGFDRENAIGCISALYDEANASSLSGLCVTVDSFHRDVPFIVDDTPGLGMRYDGVGVTAGEGSARLLYDYEAEQQAEILDLLFKPAYALKADVLKLEIGGDGNVMQGSSPSHQHFAGESPNVARGTQAWLAQQARGRNPAIKLYALPWAFPGWMRQGQATSSPFTNPAAAATYVVAWLSGMRDLGVPVDIVGVYSDNWDATLSPNYVIALKNALFSAGLQATQIICDDASGGWPCADQAVNPANPVPRPDLLDAVDIFAGHGMPGAAIVAGLAGKRQALWLTHLSDAGVNDLLGATYLSWQISELAVNGGVSLGVVWGATCATYDGMPEFNQGLIRADSPWSGSYYVTPALWAVAHTSAFNAPGWFQLATDSGVGVMAGSGSYVTRMQSDGSAFSIVVSKGLNHDGPRNRGLRSEVATFALRGKPLAAAQAAGVAYGVPNGVLHVYLSNFGGSPSGNASFAKYVGTTPLYQVNGAGDWLVSVFSGLDTIQTLTTSPSLFPPQRPVTSPPPPAAFPRLYSADWTTGARAVGQPAPYVVDISGSFEIVAAPTAGLQQLATDVPLSRFQTDVAPHAVLGDEEWTDVSFTARVWFPSRADSAMIAVRGSAFQDGDNNHVSGMDVRLQERAREWRCTSAGPHARPQRPRSLARAGPARPLACRERQWPVGADRPARCGGGEDARFGRAAVAAGDAGVARDAARGARQPRRGAVGQCAAGERQHAGVLGAEERLRGHRRARFRPEPDLRRRDDRRRELDVLGLPAGGPRARRGGVLAGLAGPAVELRGPRRGPGRGRAVHQQRQQVAVPRREPHLRRRLHGRPERARHLRDAVRPERAAPAVSRRGHDRRRPDAARADPGARPAHAQHQERRPDVERIHLRLRMAGQLERYLDARKRRGLEPALRELPDGV